MVSLSFFFFSIRGHRKHFSSLWIPQNFWKILLFKLSFNIWSQTWKHSSLWTYCAYVKKPPVIFSLIPTRYHSCQASFFTSWGISGFYSSPLCLFTQFSCYFPMVLYLSSKWTFLLLCTIYLGINCKCAPNSSQDTLDFCAGVAQLLGKQLLQIIPDRLAS